MTVLTISIDRQSKSFAVFQGFEVVRPFEKFTNEAEAEGAARAFVAERTDKEPEMVYPSIQRMTVKRHR